MSIRLDPTLHDLPRDEFAQTGELIDALGQGCEPVVVMVACSHLGFAPDQISHANPGEVCVLQNAAGTVPAPCPEAESSIAASLGMALQSETVQHLVVCGHTGCRCLDQVLCSQPTNGLSYLARELADVRSLVGEHYSLVTGDDLLEIAVRENVLVQLEKLRRYPLVQERIRARRLGLHGWLVCDETAVVHCFDPATGQFESPAASRQRRQALSRRSRSE